MADVLTKCSICGAILDEEDLFCPNCGTEAPSQKSNQDSAPAAAPATHIATCNFTCRGCGASMSYDASAGTLRCPFCGSEQLEKTPDANEIAPDGVVPFAIERDQAVAAMREYLGRGFWRPGDLVSQAAVVTMTPVFVPYWVFQAKTETYWTADTNDTPAGARGDWYPLTGQHEGTYEGLLINASATLTNSETAALCPFDLATAVTPEKIDLENITYERFTVPRKYARPLARQGFEVQEAEACEQYVPGKCRNMKVNVRISGLASRPMLLPVWIMAYRYRDRVFRFLVNGQTGQPAGEVPISYQKIGVAIAIAVLVLILILLLFGRSARGDQTDFRSSAISSQCQGMLPSSAVPASVILPDGSQQPYTAGKPPCANRFCTLPTPRPRKKMMGFCAHSGWPTWSVSGPSPSGWGLRLMPPASAVTRWGTFCSMARLAWAKRPSPPASRASWA